MSKTATAPAKRAVPAAFKKQPDIAFKRAVRRVPTRTPMQYDAEDIAEANRTGAGIVGSTPGEAMGNFRLSVCGGR